MPPELYYRVYIRFTEGSLIYGELPNLVNEQCENRDESIVVTPGDKKGTMNSIYAGCIRELEDGRILIVDNRFDKTKK